MSGANYKNRLRKKLEDHSTPMNLELEWAALEARRPNKKKRPLVWFWFGSAAMMITFLIWYNIDQANLPSSHTTKNDAAYIDQQSSSASHLTKKDKTSIETVGKQNSVDKTNTTLDIAKGSKDIILNSQGELGINKIRTIDLIKKETTIDVLEKGTNSISPNENQTNSKKQKNTFSPITQLPNKGIIFLPTSYPILTLSFSNAVREKIVPPKKSIWGLGIKTAYGKSFRQLNAPDPTSELLIDKRNKFETALDSWNVTLNLSRMINQNWFAEFGIGYSQTTDRFQYTYVTTDPQLLPDQVTSIIYKQDGTTEIILGEVISEETTTTKSTYYHYNKNTFAQILFGRRISFNNHLGSSFSTGLNYSLFTLKSGTIFNDASSNTYDDLSQSNYRKTGLTNLLIQAEVYYLMRKNWEASIGFHASGSLNNSFNRNNDFFEKRKVGSLKVGLMKWF